MVDVSAKSPSVREATAAGEIAMSIATADLIKSGDAKKETCWVLPVWLPSSQPRVHTC